ncbi:hypothetical protein [uncultured Roseobacter sp.]|nr:hypothetical protein [uncultured Roseobacter sp.]
MHITRPDGGRGFRGQDVAQRLLASVPRGRTLMSKSQDPVPPIEERA